MTDLISSEKLSESIFLTVIVLIVLCTGMLDRWGHWVTDGVWAYKECRMLFIFACIEVRDMNVIDTWMVWLWELYIELQVRMLGIVTVGFNSVMSITVCVFLWPAIWQSFMTMKCNLIPVLTRTLVLYLNVARGEGQQGLLHYLCRKTLLPLIVLAISTSFFNSPCLRWVCSYHSWTKP